MASGGAGNAGVGSLGGFSGPMQWPPSNMAQSLPPPTLLEPYMGPLSGVDHMLAFLALGIWSIRLKRPLWWELPGLFSLAMFLGLGAARHGDVLLSWKQPLLPWSVAGACLLLVAVIYLRPLLISRLTWARILLPIFGMAHGLVHGGVREVPEIGFGGVLLLLTLSLLWMVPSSDA
ncbi:MAG: HupE/UreJ family protein [Magnetococcales bacterium]|nr:HupE/UreJ family protein [Magnetococcales bacterium]